MLKIGFSVFTILTLLFLRDTPRSGDQLERFWHIYSKWASEHPEYECSVSPEIEVAHSRFRLWQIKRESGGLDGILKVTSNFPIPYESYVFMTDEGCQVMYFPETRRNILLCPKRNSGAAIGVAPWELSFFSGDLKLIRKFLILEDLRETDEGIVFEMILDAEKMRDLGLVPEQPQVRETRFIFALKKSGELVRLSRQFDDGDLEVLYFDYVSFSPDEVHERFPRIENRSSRNIALDFTYKDALDEIMRVRQHAEASVDK